jgi:hypothetical protein
VLTGWLVLALLTGAVALNAVGVAVRVGPSGRAELATVAATAFYGFLATPVLLLGFVGLLTARNLGLVEGLAMAGTFALLVGGRPVRVHLGDCARAFRGLATLPRDALVEAARARSLVLLGVVCAGLLIVHTLLVAVLVPCTSWDGLMYHGPIVGFAIQNHGFAPVPLPPNDTVQATNGYPRVCEAVGVWFTIFTDVTLLELPNVLAAPAMMLAAYALVRRFGDRVTSMGYAAALILMPQAWAQLCQVCIDIQVGFFAVAALYFATRPTLRTRDVWCATAALALLMGSKFSGLSMVPPIALVAYARLIPSSLRRRPLSTLSAIVGGGLALLGIAAAFPLRNWRAFKNPLWPVSFDNARLGIHWKGLKTMAEVVADSPMRPIVDAAYEVPVHGFRDIIDRGYGYGLAWVVIPLGLLAVAIGGAVVAAELLRIKERRWASTLGWVLLLLVVGLFTAPTLSGRNARYNLHLVAGLMAAVAWLFSRQAWARPREGAVATAIVLSLMPFFWTDGFQWAWGMTDDPWAVFLHPLAHHRYLEKPTFDFLAQQRAAELAPGDEVDFDDGIIFIGALWNFDFSSSIRYVPFESEKAFLATIDRRAPRWVAAGNPGAQAALEHSHCWQLVGKLSPVGEQRVYRRLARSS